MLLTFAPSAFARCNAAPSVSVSGPTTTGFDGTTFLTVTYSYPDTEPDDRWLGFWYDGQGPVFLGRPNPASGSREVWITFTCKPGTHTLDFYATSCGGGEHGELTARQSVPMATPEPQPSLTVAPITEINSEGYMQLRATADFPNTSDASQRYMNVYIDGRGVFDFNPMRPGTNQGFVWEPWIRPGCLSLGTHRIGALASSCGGAHQTYREFTATATAPTVDVAVVKDPQSGADVAQLTYDFSGTAVVSGRYLGLQIDGGNPLFIRPDPPRGTWPVVLPTCWRELLAQAVACGGEGGYDEERKTNPLAEKPQVDVSNRRDRAASPSDNGQQTALVKWAMPHGSNGWRLLVETLPSVGDDGVTISGGVIYDREVTSPTGETEVAFTPPSGARTIVVRATAITSCARDEDEAAFECGECQGAPQGVPQGTGDPVYFADGNMRYSDSDPLPALLGGRGLSRTYDSQHQVRGVFGRGWTSMFDQRLLVTGMVGSELVYFTSGSNDVVMFRKRGSTFEQTWPRGTSAPAKLLHDSAAGVYEYRAAGADRALRFRASDGRLRAERILSTGRELTIAYDAVGKPVSASDSWTGLTWTITVSGQRVTTIGVADQPDLTWTYEYAPNDTLALVRAPGGSMWRRYEYASGRLTAVYDAADHLIESHAYDVNGFAATSRGPSDEITSITYTRGINGEVTARVTLAAGGVSEFTMRPIAGALRTVRVRGGCSSCGGARDAIYVYDVGGRLVRRQDARGYITETAYAGGRVVTTTGPLRPATCDPETDPNHCRLTEDALATALLAATPAKVTTRYAYADAAWPDRATTIATTSVTGGVNERVETFTYDAATGEVLQHSIQGWTGSPSQIQARTTTNVFNDGVQGAPFAPGGTVFLSSWITLPQPRGTRRAADGPRSGTADTTLWLYYPVDSSVPTVLRGRLAAVRNPVGHLTRFERYDAFGNPLRVVDPNGVTTEATYDRLGRLLTRTIKGVAGCDTTVDPVCGTDLTTTRSYSPAAGKLATEVLPGGGVTTYEHSSTRGRLTAVSRGPSLANLVERQENVWDATTALKTEERTMVRSGDSWIEARSLRFAYDGEGRLVRTLLPPFGPAGYVEENVYGPDGDLIETKDARHSASNTKYDYDAAGRLAVQKLLSAPGTWIETRYDYDVAGNLTKVRDPNGNETTYQVDDFGQVLRQVSDVAGTATYTYDAAGYLLSTTDGANNTTTYTYDVMGRVLTATSSRPGAGSEVVIWTYDEPAGGFALGRLTKMTDPTGFTTYRYERRGLLASEEKTFNGNVSTPSTWVYTTRFEYDRDGNRSKIVYPSGQTVSYTHDFAGRPLTATSPLTSFVTDAKYLPFGPPIEIGFGNGTRTTMQYDSRYRIMENKLTGPAGTIAKYDYSYDAAGNIMRIADATDPGYDRTFVYDDLNRLTTANTGNKLWGSGGYNFDAMGNMLALTIGAVGGVGSRTATFHLSGTTAKLAGVTENGTYRDVQYDGAGNETRYILDRAYSSRNLLATVDRWFTGVPAAGHRISYAYDGRNIRVARAEGNTDTASNLTSKRFYLYTPELQLLMMTAWDRTNPFKSTWWANLIESEFVWFNGVPVAQTAPFNLPPPRYAFTDHLGTPILQTDATARVVWRAEYEPFGSVFTMRSGNREEQPLRFPGQEVAMMYEGQEERYNIFRWYRSGWGRYTQGDPIGLEGGINLFLYGQANPSRFTDSLGLDTAGCDNFPTLLVTRCVLQCCARHDACFDANHCTAGSWGTNPRCGCDLTQGCDDCNDAAVTCITDCHERHAFPRRGDPMYYCGAQHRYIRIPGDFPTLNAARAACQYDYMRDCTLPPPPPRRTIPPNPPAPTNCATVNGRRVCVGTGI